ncbi:unnamed protein product [Parnassius apollo]|uniref:(apollo) hypothetical protein n=1 Tax=Parnassius apollo TaxID=110799 RepID=A0A8S3W8W8_PARAO|nr:unnamed protein product [Parnassius apollo]
MEVMESMPVAFKEIAPNHNIPEKWKEIMLNTGGTHSTLQDIKLPQKAGGYWYKDSKKANTRNRFIYWQTTSDAIELSEASLDVNLSASNLRCKVAPGTPPLNSLTFYERLTTQEVIILAATVSSVHRLIFPHPESLERKSTFGSVNSTSTSIFHDTSAVNNHNNYSILNQYSNTTTGVAHTCASMLRDSGEAVFALAFGHGVDGGLLLVKLPVTGSAVTTLLKRESTVPRFLSGITGALRGKSNVDGVETYGVVLTSGLVVAICGDTCLRAWTLDEGGAPAAVSSPLSQTTVRPKPPPQGHMLKSIVNTDRSVILVAYLSFPNDTEFVVMRIHDAGGGAIKFSHVCQIFGPQLDLLDYTIGYGDGNHVIWALWNQPDGEAVITSSSLGAEVSWRCVAGREPPPPLPQLSSHQQYRDRLLTPGLFPPAVIKKALVIYRRTWCGGEASAGAGEGELGEAAAAAVTSRLRTLAARTAAHDNSKQLMHKCWSDLYSWCLQYMEGLQKPLGLMVAHHKGDAENGWWCAVVRRAGISLVRELEPLERMMLSPEPLLPEPGGDTGSLSADAVRVVAAGARWERAVSAGGAAELERRLFACVASQNRLLPALLHLLLTPAPSPDQQQPTLTPQQIDELTSILEPIKDLQNAVLELNDALRLDVPDLDTSKSEDEDTSEYDNLFASDLGVAVVTEAIRQMAEMRARVVRGALAALGVARGAGGVPGAGHCAVHWQAYRALLWLHTAALHPPPTVRCSGCTPLRYTRREYRVPGAGHCAVHGQAYRALLWLHTAGLHPPLVPRAGRRALRRARAGLPCAALAAHRGTTPAGSTACRAPGTAPCTGRPTVRCSGCTPLHYTRREYRVPGAGHCAVHEQAYRALLWLHTAALHPPPTVRCSGCTPLRYTRREYRVPGAGHCAVHGQAYRALLWLHTAAYTRREYRVPGAGHCAVHGQAYRARLWRHTAARHPPGVPRAGRRALRRARAGLPCAALAAHRCATPAVSTACRAPGTAPCTGRPTVRCSGCTPLRYTRREYRVPGAGHCAVHGQAYRALLWLHTALHYTRREYRVPGAGHCAVHGQAYRALLWLHTAALHPPSAKSTEAFRLKLSALGASAEARGAVSAGAAGSAGAGGAGAVAAYAWGTGGRRARRRLAAAHAPTHALHALPLMAYHLAHQLWAVSGGFEFGWWLASINQPQLVQNYVAMLEPWCEWNACSRQFILGLSLLDMEEPEGAYTAFCKAAKGVSTEPFLRHLVAAADDHLTQHQALVLYYMKVIKLFEIHDAGACVVRLAETAISIADKDDPNLPMFQWVVFKWHLAGGRVERALSAAAANPAPHARASAATQLLTTLAARRQLGALVRCGALAGEAERAAAARAKLHDAAAHNPYYDFLYALHVARHHYRKAAAVMYERATRCAAEQGAAGARRKWLAAALTCLRLARPHHAFLARPVPAPPTPATADSAPHLPLQIIGPEELAAELRAEDPESMDPVQLALQRHESIDFDYLHPHLNEADGEILLAVTKRAISTEQFLPRWFLLRFMEVDGATCIRALLAGGRALEAGAACVEALRAARCALGPRAAPAAAPLAPADLLLAELRAHRHLAPCAQEIIKM